MFRIVIGSVAGGIAMFVVGFVLWATPLARIGYSSVPEQQSAAVQTVLAQNLPATGKYVVPNPSSASGTVLYGRGPVATVNFNTRGFSANGGGGSLIGGLIQSIVVTLMFGLALWPILGRVTDFASRARVVVGIAAAAVVLVEIAEPIYSHGAWRFAIYATIADILMLAAGGLVLARWFLPSGAGTVRAGRA